MYRLTKMSFGIAAGLIAVAISTMALATASASQGSGLIVVNPASYDFGGVVEQVQSVNTLIEVRNDGTSNLVVNNLAMVGQNAGEFHISAEFPFTLPPGDQRRIVVSFDPASTGPKAAVLRILSNASNQSQTDVQLRGTGLALAVLGHVSAGPVLNNTTVSPGNLITVEVRVNMNGANPPAHLMQSYQASLSWDAAVLSFQGYAPGDAPWGSPASIGLSNSTLTWFDSEFNGVGGDLAIIRLKFKVVGQAGSSSNLNLSFSRMEGVDVENLLPILNVSNNQVNVVASSVPPDIDVSPTLYDYGAVVLGSSASRTFVVRNTGMQNLIVSSTSLQGTNSNQFSIVSGGGAFTLAAGQSRNVVVSYNPTSPGTKSAALVFLSNDPDERIYYVALSGSVLAPHIDVQPGSIDFGNVAVGSMVSRTLVVRNTGTATLQLVQFGLDNHQNQFAYNSNQLALLAPGQSGNITVFFNPTTAGAKSASFVISSNDPDKATVTIPLSGVGQ